MAWICLVFGHKEVTVDLKEDPLHQVFGWGDVVLIETLRCLRCGEERKIRSIGKY